VRCVGNGFTPNLAMFLTAALMVSVGSLTRLRYDSDTDSFFDVEKLTVWSAESSTRDHNN